MIKKHNKYDPRDVYPLYAKNAYYKAAKKIRNALKNEDILNPENESIVENWRASHRHILNAWQVTLKQRCGDHNIVFAQRLKRKSTIYNKLLREPNMSLVKMHDIAGCRLIFRNFDEMADYINHLHSSKKMKHRLIKEYNYISKPHPQNTGYRGIHDEYIYNSRKASDRSDRWDGLYLEIQFRTIYQHAWATAVEVADNVTKSNTKFNQGNEDQKEFFRLASEIIARTYEGQTSCYPELSAEKLVQNFEGIERKINLLHRLKQIKIIKDNTKWKKKNIILHFANSNSDKPTLRTIEYESFSMANKEYFALEKKFPIDDIVLVRTSDNSISRSIQNAFRNYFSDAKDFIEYVENGLKAQKGLLQIVPSTSTKRIIAIPLQEELPW